MLNGIFQYFYCCTNCCVVSNIHVTEGPPCAGGGGGRVESGFGFPQLPGVFGRHRLICTEISSTVCFAGGWKGRAWQRMRKAICCLWPVNVRIVARQQSVLQYGQGWSDV